MHLISKNRKIKIWYYRLKHTSNAKVIEVAILVNDINLQKAKYNSFEVFVNLEESKYDTSNKNSIKEDNNIIDKSEQNMDIIVAALIFQTFTPDLVLDLALETLTIDLDLKKICTTYIASKFTQIVKQHKNIIPANKKLKVVHTNLWRPHNLSLRSNNIYTAILICKYTRKI